MDENDHALITELERALWDAPTRNNPSFMDEVLDDEFVEFGASGNVHPRAAVLAPTGVSELVVQLSDVHVMALSDDTVLVTYRASEQTGASWRHTLRSSLWVRRQSRWRLRFHQGTITLDGTFELG